MTDGPQRSAGGWGRRLLALSLSTLLGIVLAEAGLRAYFWSQGVGRQNVRELIERSKSAKPPELHGGGGLFGRMEPSPYPEIVYQLKPHLNGTLRGALVRTNRFGLRGPEVKKRKPANTYRIVGLGDSHMFGWAVDQGDEYLRLLEGMLNRHAEGGWKFEVLNFGTPGYNTVMEVATFEHRALDFDPDLVLLHFVGNDLFPPHFLRPPPGLAPSSWYLVELVKGFVTTRREGTSDFDAEENDDSDDGEAEKPSAPPGRPAERPVYAHLGGRMPFQRAMARLAELTRERHIPVLHFVLGVDGTLRRWARDQGLALGFRFLDVQPSFGAMVVERGIAPDRASFRKAFVRNAHPSPLGHLAYARALFCELERMQVPHLRPAPEECSWEQISRPAGEPAAPS